MIIRPSKSFKGSELPGSGELGHSYTTFTKYLDTLNWGPGSRDESGWAAFLRAGSLAIDPSKAVEEVSSRIRAGGGAVDSAKLQSQLRRAYSHTKGEQPGALKALLKPTPPTFSPEKLKAFAAKVSGVDASWLRSRSPVSTTDVNSTGFLQCLYQAEEKVLVFTDYRSQGQHLHVIRGRADQPPLPSGSPEGVWFLVNPVDGNYYPNPRQEHKLSRRSEESITSWRYLVLESDVAEQNEWLACLVQLPLRIAAIYTSGGKSIHALVRLDAESKADWDRQRDAMAPILVTWGADKAALTAVRLSRLPCTLRGDRPQELLFLNPSPSATPIINTESQR